MTLSQIKQLLGTSNSNYIDPDTLGDQALPVIIAKP